MNCHLELRRLVLFPLNYTRISTRCLSFDRRGVEPLTSYPILRVGGIRCGLEPQMGYVVQTGGRRKSRTSGLLVRSETLYPSELYDQKLWGAYRESNPDSSLRRRVPCALDDRLTGGPLGNRTLSKRLKRALCTITLAALNFVLKAIFLSL